MKNSYRFVEDTMNFNPDFKSALRNLILKPMPYQKISFSQCGEDLIVKHIFNSLKIQKPSYIDIGAHDPFKLSNTALFYFHGSRGINIEPDPSLFSSFLQFRKEDINLNIGIGKKPGTYNLYLMSHSAHNTFSKKEAQRLVSQENFNIISVKKIKVKTIGAIIKKYHKNIFPDFLSLDAEGVDEIIIKSIDFTKNYPLVICLETISYSNKGKGKKNRSIIRYLQQKGYIAYADTNINTIFVKKNRWIRS